MHIDVYTILYVNMRVGTNFSCETVTPLPRVHSIPRARVLSLSLPPPSLYISMYGTGYCGTRSLSLCLSASLSPRLSLFLSLSISA